MNPSSSAFIGRRIADRPAFSIACGLVLLVMASACEAKRRELFRQESIVAHCRWVATTISEAVERYERYVAESPCRDVEMVLCERTLKPEADDSEAWKKERSRQLDLPLGWDDREDLARFLTADLGFCIDVVVANAERRGALHKKVWSPRSGFAQGLTTPADVADALKALRDVANEIQGLVEAAARDTASVGK